jgi:hypothetical protein
MQVSSGINRRSLILDLAGILFLVTVSIIAAQIPVIAQNEPQASPIAIVPIDSSNPDQGASVTGALEVTSGKATIAASGSITSAGQTTRVILPHRGELRVCASTTVKLAANSSGPAGDTPGLLMAMDHGAIEMSLAAGTNAQRNADILLTPDFRILIGGPGATDVKVRLGSQGDTCIDNPGANAPYVLVSSVFDGGAYRVQPGQRVMFQHGSLHEVVDQEKEACGCPPAEPRGNEFPLAQSEGLAPMPKPAPSAETHDNGTNLPVEPLVYKSSDHAPQPAATESAPSANPAPQEPPKKKPGLFKSIGRFFKRIFGADQ